MTNKYTIDAAGRAVGRVATEVAVILMGKNSPAFKPNQDNTNRVVVTNANKVILSGKKLEQKAYFHYSGYPGGITKTSVKKLFKVSPSQIIKKAVRQMLPKNKLQANRLNRLSFK